MHTYTVPLYKALIHFTRSRKEFSTQAAKWGFDGDIDDCGGICLESDSGNYIVGVFSKDPGTLAHECAHAALNIISNAGFTAEAGNQEPFCYLLGDLVAHFSKVK